MVHRSYEFDFATVVTLSSLLPQYREALIRYAADPETTKQAVNAYGPACRVCELFWGIRSRSQFVQSVCAFEMQEIVSVLNHPLFLKHFEFHGVPFREFIDATCAEYMAVALSLTPLADPVG